VIYVTAVFNRSHAGCGAGFLRSFRDHMPDATLLVCTDGCLPEPIFGEHIVCDFETLYGPFGEFYERGPRRNVFKLAVLRSVRAMHPDETICWLDCDTVVLDDLGKHLKEGRVNVLAHSRRDKDVDVGNGVTMPAHSYVMGGCFTVPPGPYVRELLQLAHERPGWVVPGDHSEQSGDQILLNHLVARHPDAVNYVTDDDTHLFNFAHYLDEGEHWHPRAGERTLRRIAVNGTGMELDGRRIALFYWVSNTVHAHAAEGFNSFRPEVADLWLDYYRDLIRDPGIVMVYARSEVLCKVILGECGGGPLTGAEVGSWRGQNARSLLANIPRLRLLCVDPWRSFDDYEAEGMIGHSDEEWDAAHTACCWAVHPFNGRGRVMRATSLEAAECVADTFDFVFIDGNHSYGHVRADIAAWRPKLKPGGLLCGHDFHMEGVRRAVTEACPDVQGGRDENAHVWWVTPR